MLLLMAMMLQAVEVGRTPPPPPSPPIADSAVVRSAIAVAERCVDGTNAPDHNGSSRAARTVRALDATPGSRTWKAALPDVEVLVRRRRDEKRCIDDLECFRFQTPMSTHDRDIVDKRLQGLASFWRDQAAYEAAILAEFIDKTLASNDPSTHFIPR